MADEPNTESDSPGTMVNRMRVVLDGLDDHPLVDRVERMGLGLEGMIESTEIRLTRAGCGHIIHTGAEAGGVCADPRCGTVLCNACAAKEENTCAGCGMTVCRSCQRRTWTRADDAMLCGPCSRKWWVREVLVAAVVAVGVLLLVAVLVHE